MSPKRILCVGVCVLDIVQVCKQFPKEDSDERSITAYWQRGGNASNNCSVLAQLGADCEFIGTLSNKNHLKFLIDDFNAFGINVEHCTYHDDCDAPMSTVILCTDSGSRTILHNNPNLTSLTVEEFERIDLDQYSWIHFEGRNMHAVSEMIERIVKYNAPRLENNKITISVDMEKPKDNLMMLVTHADVLFLGRDFVQFRGCDNMVDGVKNIAQEAKKGATIICAWGDKGAVALSPDGVLVTSPSAPPPQVIDTLGAGDTFCATVIYSLSNKMSLQKSIELGCTIAGAKVGIKGYKGLDHIFKELKRTGKCSC